MGNLPPWHRQTLGASREAVGSVLPAGCFFPFKAWIVLRMECHEALSKTTTFQYDVSNVQGFFMDVLWCFSSFCWGIFKFICRQLMKNPNLTPFVQPPTTVKVTIHGGFCTTTVQPTWAGAFGISSTSWEMTLGIPATVTCQNCDSAMRADGAKIYNMAQQVMSHQT